MKGGKRIRLSWIMDDFFPEFQGKVALISGRVTYSSLYVTTFPIEPLLRGLSYFVKGDRVSSRVDSHL